MTDWFKEFEDIAYPISNLKTKDIGYIPEQEEYDWLVAGIAGDIKEALTHVPLDVFLHDLERRGIYLTPENANSE